VDEPPKRTSSREAPSRNRVATKVRVPWVLIWKVSNHD
jgi:hypothetical protein